jgi:hypothetical protein
MKAANEIARFCFSVSCFCSSCRNDSPLIVTVFWPRFGNYFHKNEARLITLCMLRPLETIGNRY